MSITMTPAASARMRSFLDKSPAVAGIRFGVKRTGCSGYAYVVDLAPSLEPGDAITEVAGVPLVIHADAMALVDGTEIDFCKQGLNASFVFHNPNATGECGCGESFTVS